MLSPIERARAQRRVRRLRLWGLILYFMRGRYEISPLPSFPRLARIRACIWMSYSPKVFLHVGNMSSFTYDALKRMPNHRWPLEHKVALCTLRDSYQLCWTNVKRIFDALFPKEFQSPRGPSRDALISMYYQLQKDKYKYTGQWKLLKETIETEAIKFDIPLINKIALRPANSTPIMEKTKDARSREDSPSSTLQPKQTNLDLVESNNDSDDTLLGDSYNQPSSSMKLRGSFTTESSLRIPGLMTPISSTISNGQPITAASGLPLFEFRT